MPAPSLASSPDDALAGPTRAELEAAYAAALAKLEAVQQPRGAWAGEAIWNPMLPCQWVIVQHLVGRPIPTERKARIRRHLELHRKRDGGWGMHPDIPDPLAPLDHGHGDAGPADKDHAWLFHTTLGYVALRLLGEDPNDPLLRDALAWIHRHGPVHTIPTWGRIWLALLGLHPWSEVQPLLPELWLMPDESPVHPRRLYNHMRLIYLGLSYLYGAAVEARPSPILDELRRELYPGGWSLDEFRARRDTIAPTDLYEPIGPALQRTGTVACTGPEPLRMADFVASLRQQQGHGPALVMRLPLPLTRLSARAGDLLPASVPWCSESLALLDSDNVGDPAAFESLLGRPGVHYSQLVAGAWR